ncbi:MAG: helix-turn-helix domain-containing protein [Micavibrio sp.]|nr:helix-turn-helix domain-containing protein [Micavibrio sp.]
MCLTQEQFAELLGVTQGRVSQWEKNMGHPNGSAVRLLKQVLARIERSEKV